MALTPVGSSSESVAARRQRGRVALCVASDSCPAGDWLAVVVVWAVREERDAMAIPPGDVAAAGTASAALAPSVADGARQRTVHWSSPLVLRRMKWRHS